MSVLAEFEGMLTKIGSTIEDTLQGEIADFTKKTLQESMQYSVYTYNASPWAMRSRRGDMGGLADMDLMRAEVIDVSKKLHTAKELQVESLASFQHGPDTSTIDDHWGANDALPANESASRLAASGARLDEVVETGSKAYRQPYPRPFYANAEKYVVNYGAVSGYLVINLIKAGFDVQVL